MLVKDLYYEKYLKYKYKYLNLQSQIGGEKGVKLVKEVVETDVWMATPSINPSLDYEILITKVPETYYFYKKAYYIYMRVKDLPPSEEEITEEVKKSTHRYIITYKILPNNEVKFTIVKKKSHLPSKSFTLKIKKIMEELENEPSFCILNDDTDDNKYLEYVLSNDRQKLTDYKETIKNYIQQKANKANIDTLQKEKEQLENILPKKYAKLSPQDQNEIIKKKKKLMHNLNLQINY